MTEAAAAAAVRAIVPPGSTDLERVADTTFPRAWGLLADNVEPASAAQHQALLPWAAQQWQLAQFAPYFDNVADLLAQGVPWLMQRGNAAGVRRALGWVGIAQAGIDETGAWLHLDPGRVPSSAAMAAIVHVVRASLPAHVRLYRVYHDNDARPIVLDTGPALDAGMLDGYSGVLGAHGVLESFAARSGATLPAAPAGTPRGAATQVRVSISRYADMPVLDAWRLDSRVLAATSGGQMELRSTASNAPGLAGGWRVKSQSQARASAWAAPAPTAFGQARSAGAGAVPVHPPRHWGGPWGGTWRGHFQRIEKEEP